MHDFFSIRSKWSFEGHGSTKICSDAKVQCYKEAESDFSEVTERRESSEYGAEAFRYKCNCLPACVSVEYDADIDYIKYDVEILKRTYKNVSFRYSPINDGDVTSPMFMA